MEPLTLASGAMLVIIAYLIAINSSLKGDVKFLEDKMDKKEKYIETLRNLLGLKDGEF